MSTGFVLAVAALMMVLGFRMYEEIKGVRAGLEQRQEANARSELGEAIADIDQDMTLRGQRMAEWDEARQQLANPRYYVLWRDSRLRASGLMTTTVDSVGLYDRKGDILAPGGRHDALPDLLPSAPPFFFHLGHSGRDDLQYFFPIYADPDHHILMGYGGFSFDLIDEIKRTRQFSFADPGSFSLALPDHTVVDMSKLSEKVRFRLRPQRNLDQFLTVFRDGLIRLSIFALCILLLAAFLVNQLLVRPLRRLSDEIKELRATHRLGPTAMQHRGLIHIDELENVRSSLLDYQEKVNTLTDELEQSNRLLFEQAHHDALSGAYNRRAFDNDCRRLTDEGSLGHYSLLLFDCDRFKSINDTYGHAVGDAVISALSSCLQESLRSDDRLYRMGGDEFAALLLDTTREQTKAIVERCLDQIGKYDFSAIGMTDSIVLSIGIVLATSDVSFNEALKRADLAMYRAKRSKRNKVVFYDESLSAGEERARTG